MSDLIGSHDVAASFPRALANQPGRRCECRKPRGEDRKSYRQCGLGCYPNPGGGCGSLSAPGTQSAQNVSTEQPEVYDVLMAASAIPKLGERKARGAYF